MKKRASLAILLFFLMAGVAQTAPITVLDSYIGHNDHGYGDVIGNPGYFDITKADISLSGTWLTVDIFTNFAGRADDNLFSNYTKDPYTNIKDGKGIGYGDLFLASVWDPFGDAPYLGDNHAAGTKWTYGFSLDNRWSATGGTGYLYSLEGANVFLSDNFMTGSAIWRDGQEVAVDASGLTSMSEGTWSVNSDFIRFYVNIAGTDLLGGPEIAFHWGQTCGNDVIEGRVPVSEPATMLLLGFGLIGLAGIGRKNFRT